MLPPNPAHWGRKSLRVSYYNWVPPYYGEVYRTPPDACMANFGVRALDLYYRGSAGNVAGQPIYVRLHDTSDSNATVTYDDPDLQDESWRLWQIPFSAFSGVDMNDVNQIFIGIGIDGTPSGQTGPTPDFAYFDDLRQYRARCYSSLVATDFTGDCITDNKDLNIMTGVWLNGDYTLPAIKPDANRMVVEYRFEGSGATAIDSSNQSNDGTIGGATTRVEGDTNGLACWDGNCLDFNGVANEYVQKISAVNLPFDRLDSWSINMHLYMDVQAPNTLIGGFGTANTDDIGYASNRFLATPDDEEIFVWTGSLQGSHEGVADGSFDVNTGDWQMITITYDGTSQVVKIWKNGIEVVSDTLLAPLVDANTAADDVTDVKLATDELGSSFKGKIDEFSIWNVKLEQREIWYLKGIDSVYYPLSSVANLYNEEPNNLKKINFRDYGILMEHWLKEELFGN